MGVKDPQFAYLLVLAMAVAGYFVSNLVRAPGRTIQQVLVWGLILVGLTSSYEIWPTLRLALGFQKQVVNGQTLQLTRGIDGHFHVEAQVNGKSIDFIIDTGASDIVLSKEDARTVGFDPAKLDFSGKAATANGTTETAPVRLKSLVVGPFQNENVRARINGGDLFGSLLGMSFLEDYKITISGDHMVLQE